MLPSNWTAITQTGQYLSLTVYRCIKAQDVYAVISMSTNNLKLFWPDVIHIIKCTDVVGLWSCRLQSSSSWAETKETSNQNQQHQPGDPERERAEVHTHTHTHTQVEQILTPSYFDCCAIRPLQLNQSVAAGWGSTSARRCCSDVVLCLKGNR